MKAARLCYAFCRTASGHRLARRAVAVMRRLGWRPDFHVVLDALMLNHAPLAGLMGLWSRIHWSAGDGMMPADQLLAIYELAATWPARGSIVELGSWTGLTTSYLATACRVRGDGKTYAVDTFEGTKEGNTRYPSIARFGGSTWNAFAAQIERAQVGDLVEPLVGYTCDAVRRYDGGPIRMLLIDADHSYDGVRRDFELWSPLVSPGGLIVFHDYLMPDVARFVDHAVRAEASFDMRPGHVVPNVMAVTKTPVAMPVAVPALSPQATDATRVPQGCPA